MTPIIENIPPELSKKLFQRYLEIQQNYNLRRWDSCGASAGKFVENARRIIEYKTTADQKYTPIGKSLPKFNNTALDKLERIEGSVDESWRIVIPRVLYSMYTLRNKRGAAHESVIDMSEADSLYLLHSAKWTICEIARLCANEEKTNEINSFIQKVNTRSTKLVWETGERFCISDPEISCHDQILLLLYVKGVLSVEELLRTTEYVNKSRFKKLLQSMHKDRLLYYDRTNQTCELIERGIQAAENIIRKHDNERQ